MVYQLQNRSMRIITNIFRHQKTQYSRESMTKRRNGVLGGVYHLSSPSETGILTTPLQKQNSSSSFSTIRTDYSHSTNEDEFNDSWTSSGSESHHDGAPLLVRGAVSQRHLGSLHLSDEEVLSRIMLEARHLPKSNNGYFASNHVMVNNERTKRRIVPLKRSRVLDEIAREHANRMANQQSLFHANPTKIEEKMGANKRIGANVGQGSDVHNIHKHMMQSSLSDKNNITDRRFVFMGVGTAKGADGTLYMCQVFSD